MPRKPRPNNFSSPPILRWIKLLQRTLTGCNDLVYLINPPLGHAGSVISISRQRLLQLRLLRGKDFLDLAGRKAYGVVDFWHFTSDEVSKENLDLSAKIHSLYSMPLSLKEIEQELVSLPLTERARLADMLLTSINGEDVAEVDSAWAIECKARMDAYDKGKIEAINGDAVFAQYEARFNQ